MTLELDYYEELQIRAMVRDYLQTLDDDRLEIFFMESHHELLARRKKHK